LGGSRGDGKDGRGAKTLLTQIWFPSNIEGIVRREMGLNIKGFKINHQKYPLLSLLSLPLEPNRITLSSPPRPPLPSFEPNNSQNKQS